MSDDGGDLSHVVDTVFADVIQTKRWYWYHVVGGIACLALMTAMWILQAELTQTLMNPNQYQKVWYA
jgi:hypothetical protein